jgi:hypothetical protein
MESHRRKSVTWKTTTEQNPIEFDQEDEIFFGKLSTKELLKHSQVRKRLEKNRRKTLLYQEDNSTLPTDTGTQRCTIT